MKRRITLILFVAVFAYLSFSQGLQMFETEHNRRLHSFVEQVDGFDPENVLVANLNDDAPDFAVQAVDFFDSLAQQTQAEFILLKQDFDDYGIKEMVFEPETRDTYLFLCSENKGFVPQGFISDPTAD